MHGKRVLPPKKKGLQTKKSLSQKPKKWTYDEKGPIRSRFIDDEAEAEEELSDISTESSQEDSFEEEGPEESPAETGCSDAKSRVLHSARLDEKDKCIQRPKRMVWPDPEQHGGSSSAEGAHNGDCADEVDGASSTPDDYTPKPTGVSSTSGRLQVQVS